MVSPGPGAPRLRQTLHLTLVFTPSCRPELLAAQQSCNLKSVSVKVILFMLILLLYFFSEMLVWHYLFTALWEKHFQWSFLNLILLLGPVGPPSQQDPAHLWEPQLP